MTPDELAAIKARADCAGVQTEEDILALVAEVERLRGVLLNMGKLTAGEDAISSWWLCDAVAEALGLPDTKLLYGLSHR